MALLRVKMALLRVNMALLRLNMALLRVNMALFVNICGVAWCWEAKADTLEGSICTTSHWLFWGYIWLFWVNIWGVTWCWEARADTLEASTCTASHVSCTSSSCVWRNMCVRHDSFICDPLYVWFWCAVCPLCRLVRCVAVERLLLQCVFLMRSASLVSSCVVRYSGKTLQYITYAVCCSGKTLHCWTVCVSDVQCITCVVCCSEQTLQCCTVHVSDVHYDVQYITCAVCCSGNTLQCCTVYVSDVQCITCVVCCSEQTLHCCTVYVSDVPYWCAVHHLCRLPVASVWDMWSLI